MRLNEFNLDDKVIVPRCVLTMNKSRYATIDFIGDTIAVLESESGTEFTVPSNTDGFSYYEPLEDLEALGDDLVKSIEDAAWVDTSGRNNLDGPTYHMREAVRNWKARV